MKTLRLFMLICGCFSGVSLLAQTPKAIEKDLSNSFAKIYYWYDKARNDTTDKILAENDSLEIANDIFSNKLKNYTSNYPFTIRQNFNNVNINVITSSDHLLRIYSWDTEMGGTEHDFRNVIQFQTGGNVRSILQLDTSSLNDDNYIYYYSDLFTLKAGDKTYYLGIYNGTFSNKDMEEGIQIFSIENGKLNQDIKLIKTGRGLRNKLHYYYDFFSTSKIKDGDIHYDSILKTISVPVVGVDDQVTKKRIIYKFTGKYFEKVKP